jgi:hypothetical protein
MSSAFAQDGERLSHEAADPLVQGPQHGRKVPLIGNPLLHLSSAARRTYVSVGQGLPATNR